MGDFMPERTLSSLPGDLPLTIVVVEEGHDSGCVDLAERNWSAPADAGVAVSAVGAATTSGAGRALSGDRLLRCRRSLSAG